MQPSLFDLPPVTAETVPSPLCSYERCTRRGRAVLGPFVLMEGGDCRNRSITCLTCGCTGEQSENLKPTTSKRARDAKSE